MIFFFRTFCSPPFSAAHQLRSRWNNNARDIGEREKEKCKSSGVIVPCNKSDPVHNTLSCAFRAHAFARCPGVAPPAALGEDSRNWIFFHRHIFKSCLVPIAFQTARLLCAISIKWKGCPSVCSSFLMKQTQFIGALIKTLGSVPFL